MNGDLVIQEVRKWKRRATFAALLGLVLGSSGVFGIVTWLVDAPDQRRAVDLDILSRSHLAAVQSHASSIDIRVDQGEIEKVLELQEQWLEREERFRRAIDELQDLNVRYQQGDATEAESARDAQRLREMVPDILLLLEEKKSALERDLLEG